ncbi:MAG: arginine repressor [Dialister sp.]|nr:arginine repressor [Dialister sp.]
MKRYRAIKIKEIVQKQVIETQEELAEALQREGIDVTQATVSRDIKELMLVKIPYKPGHYRYALSPDEQSMLSKDHAALLFQQAVTNIDSTSNLVIIHTIPGSAQSVAYAIDHSRDKKIMGTLAGDDTILVILRTLEDVSLFLEDIRDLLKGGKF